MLLDGKTILITGGTGSFGKCFTRYVMEHSNPKKVIIYSRDEFKQWMMENEFKEYADKLRFFIGDVRDQERLRRAFEGVDYVIHAAALKQVPACEYNPNEAIKTNIHGAMNIIEAALDTNVKKVVALSTDKAVNLSTFTAAQSSSATSCLSQRTPMSAQGYQLLDRSLRQRCRKPRSIIPFFRKLIADGQTELPITDLRMTRFWISLEQGVQLVIKALEEAKGGETFISKIPSFKITDLAEAMLPGCGIKEIGIRPGEKLHEIMVTTEDSFTTYEYEKHFIVYPQMTWNNKQQPDMSGHKVAEGFSYSSDNNTEWLSVEQIRELLKTVKTV
ncbi:MAG: UDP-N-acetylglucosamine 4,6-dehydratase (inverting) [Gallintestinimicrobium sp.]